MYVDVALLYYIEEEEPKEALQKWILTWEQTLSEKHLIGPLGSEVSHDIRIVGSQVVITTTGEHFEKIFEMRLGANHLDLTQDPDFFPINPEDWLEEPEDIYWN